MANIKATNLDTIPINKQIAEPNFVDVLKNFKQEIFSDLNCVKIGKILEFDGTKKTAKIEVVFKRINPNGSIEKPVILYDCPVFTLQGSTAFLQMPIAKDDQCIVLFSDKNLDIWFTNGSSAVPLTNRKHDISDGIAIVGLNSLTSTMADYVSNQVTLSYGGSTIKIDSSGNVTIVVKSTAKLSVTGGTASEMMGTSALALLSELNSLITSFNTHVHTDSMSGTTTVPTVLATSPAVGTTKLKGS